MLPVPISLQHQKKDSWVDGDPPKIPPCCWLLEETEETRREGGEVGHRTVFAVHPSVTEGEVDDWELGDEVWEMRIEVGGDRLCVDMKGGAVREAEGWDGQGTRAVVV